MNDINNQSPNLIGDAYRNYLIEDAKTLPNMSKEKMTEMGFRLTQEEFINKIKTDDEFAKKWGVTVEVRELSMEERNEWFQINRNGNNPLMKSDWKDFELDQQNIPTKAIYLTYNNQTEVIYE
jgi:hypothetical protein